MNAGKKFENAFKNSIPVDVYYQRLKDPAQSFNPSETLRFSLTNPYDCFMFSFPTLYTLELKSTEQNSLTYYKEEFVDKEKKQSFMIKKNQIEGLVESSKCKGIISGFIINFRKTNHTYFLHINNFLQMIRVLDRKSFNEKDVVANEGYLFEQKLKRVNYTYNIEKFIQDMQNKYI